MKITIIHGQSHTGSTCYAARLLAEKLGGEVTEFFLPRDFGAFCVGCANCFTKSETLCPHYTQLKPITDAMDGADVLILASPVYVYHVTGPMKAFLDHYGYRWVVHRPEPTMFHKQAVCISTAAGAGMRSTNRDMAGNMFFWGVGKTWRYGVRVAETSFARVDERVKARMDRETTALAEKIARRVGRVNPGLKTRLFFHLVRTIRRRRGWTEADVQYWEAYGWNGTGRPWR